MASVILCSSLLGHCVCKHLWPLLLGQSTQGRAEVGPELAGGQVGTLIRAGYQPPPPSVSFAAALGCGVGTQPCRTCYYWASLGALLCCCC